MNITTIKDDDCVIITLSGRMDATNSAEFDSAVQAILVEKSSILVDMHELEYMSSAGLRSFLCLAKGAKSKHSRLGFCSLQPMVLEIFHISGFDRMLNVYENRETGLTALRG